VVCGRFLQTDNKRMDTKTKTIIRSDIDYDIISTEEGLLSVDARNRKNRMEQQPNIYKMPDTYADESFLTDDDVILSTSSEDLSIPSSNGAKMFVELNVKENKAWRTFGNCVCSE